MDDLSIPHLFLKFHLCNLTSVTSRLSLREMYRQRLFELRQRQRLREEIVRARFSEHSLSLSADDGGYSDNGPSPGKRSGCFHCTYLPCRCDAIFDGHGLVHQYGVHDFVMLLHLLDGFLAIIRDQDVILQGCQHLSAKFLIDLKRTSQKIPLKMTLHISSYRIVFN